MSSAKPVLSPETPFRSESKRNVIVCLALVLATLLVYQPVVHNGFVNFDDRDYLGNPHIREGLTIDTIQWSFTTFHAANWHPLTWISHAVDVTLFGANPAGHHYMTVLLHAGCAVLLFLVLEMATGLGWPSVLVAALFALHPINVESVAWAAERKNVLSMLFFLGGLLAYQRYTKQPTSQRYAAVFVCFACGLMSKPQVITFPFVLLLWDSWPLKRAENLGRRIVEKLPLFSMSAASAFITVRAQTAGGALSNANGAFRSAIPYSLSSRVGNALVAYARYLGKAFWPTNLGVIYPHVPVSNTSVIAAAVLLIAITAVVYSQRNRRYLLTGWLWFLGTLVPMIGLVQVGTQSMADRYAYIPLIGLFIIVAFGLAELARVRAARIVLAGAAAAALFVSAALTYRQIRFWQNSETLWRHTIAVTNGNFVAHDQLGAYLMSRGRNDEALAEYRKSVAIYPDDPPANMNIGVFYHASGDLPKAEAQYQHVLRVSADPGVRSDAYANLASICRDRHDLSCAKSNDEEAVKLVPDKPIALIGLGLVAYRSGDYAAAAENYARALSIQPTDVGFILLGKALEKGGQPDKAQAARERAKQYSTDLAQADKTAESLLKF